MAFFGIVGNDQKLASTTYSDRESASDRAARRRREQHHRSAAAADRQGQAWEAAERARQDRGSWWRR
ncbi:hypothetical protein QT196_38855 (plasmid) [Streptomyces sp. P9-2B-2]|uniref:hypothetical protein n=1 Tax=Streptomyces sp. P9-2B-2 TaxID=3057114 RepID=UPI0025B4C6AC|nr:hypothetical protein [Streptomyces sp. P9-2B-2]WJY43224.1 hypothetical protein QT196_38855 [Streptomyces sp. P9-2B-2]